MYYHVNEPSVNLRSYSNYDFSMIIKTTTFFCLVLLIFSCDIGNHTRTYSLPKEKAKNINQTVVKKKTASSGLIWEKPATWIPSAGSSMRLASFTIPYSVGSGDLSVIQLSGNGGGMESNVNRWRRQLDLEAQNLFEIEKSIIHIEGMLGNYNVISIINQTLDSAFLCAIIPIENHTIFIKLSLRPIGITEVQDDFILFCSSLNIHN